MPLPFFYIEQTDSSGIIQLNEDTSKHVVQVLRMKNDEQLQLTDGKGNLFSCMIIDDHRKKCVVKVTDVAHTPRPAKQISLGISLVKNNTRFEWFLEKATEIGVSAVVPLLCFRTEKQHFRFDRMHSILVSAMLQSQQTWLPELWEPQKFSSFVDGNQSQQKLIAHCENEATKVELITQLSPEKTERLLLVGPEGDFTAKEISLALQNNFIAVSLGATRLRTETAGVVAATLLAII